MKQLILAFICLLFAFMSYSQSEGDTIKSPTGLTYIIHQEGEGKQAYAHRQVTVQCKGYFEDGTVFFETTEEEPFSFILGRGQVIKGWDEGVRYMTVGSNYTFIIPPDLAYGKKGYGDLIPPDKTIIFDVELLKVEDL